MPRAKENLKIEITQSTAGEMRNVQITINVPAQECLLSDLLSQRGAIVPFEAMLKQAVKNAIEDYVARTEELIAGIAGDQKPAELPSKPKPKSTDKGASPSITKRAGVPGDNPTKSQTREPSNSHSSVDQDESPSL
jgi:hypothetical protein